MSDELLSREISAGKDVFLKMSRYEGQVSFHLRHYYRNTDGDLRPSKKGVCLNEAEFELLRDCLPECEAIFDKLKKSSTKLRKTSRRKYKEDVDETDESDDVSRDSATPTKKQRKQKRR